MRDKLFGEWGSLTLPSCAVTNLKLKGIFVFDKCRLHELLPYKVIQNIGHNLVTLDISYQYDIEGSLPHSIGMHCVNLEALRISDCRKIGGRIPENYSNLKKLRHLNLSSTNVSGPIPDVLFSGATALRSVWLSFTQITGPIPASISQLTHLADLRLQMTKLSGKIPKVMANLKKLNNLNLTKTKLIQPPIYGIGMRHKNREECSEFLALLSL